MKRTFPGAALAVMGLAIAACEPPEEGGGGGFGVSDFSQGFVFLRSGDRNLYAADKRDFQDIGQLTRNGENKHPSLSPNGQQVVFVHQDTAGSTLMVVPMAGGEPRTLLASDGARGGFAHPVFSPDGQRVVFTFERGGASILAVIDAEGSGLQELSSGTLSYAAPSFFADGEHVLVAAGNASTGLTQLEKVNVGTGTASNLLNGLGNEARRIRNRAVLSKDGTRAAFDGELSTGVSRIFVADLDAASKTITQVTHYPADANANDTFPTWTGPAELAFSSDTGGNDQVYTVSSTAVKQGGALKLPSAIEPWFGPN